MIFRKLKAAIDYDQLFFLPKQYCIFGNSEFYPFCLADIQLIVNLRFLWQKEDVEYNFDL